MTLKEAAIEVLRKAGQPLSTGEIHSEIEKRKLFEFRTSSPRSVVLAALKRHAEDAHSCSPAKTKSFRQVAIDRFELLK